MELSKKSATDSIAADHASHGSWNQRHAHRIGPLTVLVLSVTFVFASLPLELGSVSRPGPGLWPLFIASLSAALAIATMFHARRSEENFDIPGLLRVSYLLVALIAYPYLFDLVGFVIPSVLIIVFMMRFLSKEPWAKSLMVAVITTGVAYILFGVLLDVRLPAFSLG